MSQGIANRKEFYMLKKQYEPRRVDEDEFAHKIRREILPTSYQLFVRNFMNPNTSQKVLFVKHGTGTGKTFLACWTAMSFVNEYRKMYRLKKSKTDERGFSAKRMLDQKTPNVIILGFGATKEVFIKTLLNYPDFGFISVRELEELRDLQENIKTEDDQAIYDSLWSRYKSRLTDKSKGGFFKFYGYQEFVNQLFNGKGKHLTKLEEQVRRSFGMHKVDVDSEAPIVESSTLRNLINGQIEDGTLSLNKTVLSELTDSLVIADEFHNTYNTNMKNNRGIAIEYILDTITSVRALFLSATIINNAASEIIDVLNFTRPSDKKLNKKSYFKTNSLLRPGALEEIGRLSQGKFSFLQDNSPEQYPDVYYEGKPMRDHRGKPYGNLLFDFVKMGDLQVREYKKLKLHGRIAAEKKAVLQSEERATLPQHLHSVYDTLLPPGTFDMNIAFKNAEGSKQARIVQHGTSKVLSGAFLQERNIARYSGKFAAVLDRLRRSMKKTAGNIDRGEKILIYHHYVHGTGALMLQELLRENGYLYGPYVSPNQETVCAFCGHPMKDHRENGTVARASSVHKHNFTPARFIVAHSKIPKRTAMANYALYNSPENMNGERIKIFIGSQIIKESMNFVGVHRMIIAALPINMSTLIQVLGRANRKNSHAMYPPEMQYVRFHILVHIESMEELRYFIKLREYVPIQEIDREINRNAVDAGINRNIIYPAGSSKKSSVLGTLYFDPKNPVAPGVPLSRLRDYTFRAHEHFQDEIKYIVYVIKRLMTLSPVYTYKQLLDSVRNPPLLSISVNPQLFSEGNFIIALRFLTSVDNNMSGTNSGGTIISQLMNQYNPFIPLESGPHKIHHVGPYYVLAPVCGDNASINPDAVTRNCPLESTINIPMKEYINSYLTQTVYADKKETVLQFMNKREIDREDLCLFVKNIPVTLQIGILKEALASQFFGKTEYDLAYGHVLKLFDMLGSLVSVAELKQYDMLNYYGSRPPKSGFVGYETDKVIQIIAPENFSKKQFNGKMSNIQKTSLNRMVSYRDGDHVIGIISTGRSGDTVFKIRKPYTVETRSEISDLRQLHTGANCETREKSHIVRDIKSLSPNILDGLPRSAHKVESLCEILFLLLIQREISERRRPSSDVFMSKSRVKYIYFWWNNFES